MSNLNAKGTVLNNSTCFAGRATYRSDFPYKRHFMNTTMTRNACACADLTTDQTTVRWKCTHKRALTNNIFPSLEDNLMTRPSDSLNKHVPSPDATTGAVHMKHEMMYGAHPSMSHPPHMDTLELMEPLCSPSLPPLPSDTGSSQIRSSIYSHPMNVLPTTQPHSNISSIHHHHTHTFRGAAGLSNHSFDRLHAEDSHPRDLETFAERFKQRRIKLGVTQADVGRALVHLKIPGVGTLSQSTICRFESLTLSRNNMMALRPVLQSWLEAAESQARGKKRDTPFVLPAGEKKRKRTSIAAIEKRSLEAYFAVQQRPSGEKIASIAEKLDLKKSVVRVWFCNQRQKQKRMKYSASQNIN